jgi:SAM-dependent methyltransferase
VIAHANKGCRICGSEALAEIESFRRLGRVTSDCQPWGPDGRLTVCSDCGTVQKRLDQNWLDEIEQIYASYTLYHQAEGKEQPIFLCNGAAPVPRSVSLVRYLDERIVLGDTPDVLDFGCGVGSALLTFSNLHPSWRLYGAERSARGKDRLREIPGFVELFTCPPADIPLRFDLITLLHVLEHVLDPIDALRDLAGRLESDGAVFVQVPDAARSPYDLVVADHLTHFTPETLVLAAGRAGLAIFDLTDALLPKELTLLAKPNSRTEDAPVAVDPRAAMQRVSAQVDWLVSQAEAANSISHESRSFGLFGTSISGTWLAAMLGDRVSFFVDEDESRIGRAHMGRPIFAPDQVNQGADVFIPLIPNIAGAVRERLSGSDVTYHIPPSIGAG